MKGRLIIAGMLLVVALGVSPLPAAAQAATVLTGGGTATQCQFALKVVIPGDGSATGHFDLDGRKPVLALMREFVASGRIDPSLGKPATYGEVQALMARRG